MQTVASPREMLETLLSPRGLQRPDGRPLYRYRFTREEYEALGAFLRRQCVGALLTSHGSALVVANVAEWFRRDRGGGYWDWMRPLRSIGLHYGEGYGSPIQYGDIISIVSRGFAIWGRPEPAGSDRLFSVVREAGFPSASVRENPRIATWLKKSVLAAERGYSARDAVRAEAWRVADTIAATLFQAAEELCEAVVELRRLLPQGTLLAREDPIVILDRTQTGWRERLPFDVELEDVREMVETIVRARADRKEGLAVTRRLVGSGGAFSATAEIELEGNLHLRRLPPAISAEIVSLTRMRIVPKPPLGEGLPIAAVERVTDEEGEEGWTLRRFVSRFEVVAPLEEAVRVMLVTGDRLVTEFMAFAGEPLPDPVLALEIEELEANGHVRRLRVIGPSPVRTAKPRLALAIDEAAFDAVTFSNGFEELGRCSGKRVIAFSGIATFHSDGARLSWRTGADREDLGRLVLVGDLLRGVREPVFRGFPQIFLELDGAIAAIPPNRLRCRPGGVGGGPWRPYGEAPPYGRVQVAIFDGEDMLQQATTAIVPPAFTFVPDARTRTLLIRGLLGATVGASAPAPLPAQASTEHVLIDLARLATGATLRLSLRWQSEIGVTMTDPLLDKALLDPDARTVSLRAVLPVDGLHGYRLVSAAGERISFELAAPDTRSIHLIRSITGEVPLSAYSEDLLRLLGGSELLDAEVRLSWLGSADRAAVIKWYSEDVDPFDAPGANAFAALAQQLGPALKAFSLMEPAAGIAKGLSRSAPRVMSARLSDELGPGPWLVYGRRPGGGKIRPRILSPIPAIAGDNRSHLRAAIAEPDARLRANAIEAAYRDTARLHSPDRRLLIELLVRMRAEGLPFCSLDALKVLGHHPATSVSLLWSCETIEERAAVLDLQRELPFLWCSTPIEAWLGAVDDRLNSLRSRLEVAGLPSDMAADFMFRALGETLDLRPELVMHLRAVYLFRLAGVDGQGRGEEIGGRLARMAAHASEDHDVLLNDFIDRHADCGTVPRDLFTPEMLGHVESAWRSFDDGFAAVLAAPHLAAEHAAGRLKLGASALRRCRDAWVYDPFYFERTVPYALDAIARGRNAGGT